MIRNSNTCRWLLAATCLTVGVSPCLPQGGQRELMDLLIERDIIDYVTVDRRESGRWGQLRFRVAFVQRRNLDSDQVCELLDSLESAGFAIRHLSLPAGSEKGTWAPGSITLVPHPPSGSAGATAHIRNLLRLVAPTLPSAEWQRIDWRPWSLELEVRGQESSFWTKSGITSKLTNFLVSYNHDDRSLSTKLRAIDASRLREECERYEKSVMAKGAIDKGVSQRVDVRSDCGGVAMVIGVPDDAEPRDVAIDLMAYLCQGAYWITERPKSTARPKGEMVISFH